MSNKENKIVIAMDNDINDGMRFLEIINEDPDIRKKIYGVKIGSLWVLEKGISITSDVRDKIWDDCVIILDMQKWPTDIPEIVKRQVYKIAEIGVVDELIACPMGGGRKSLEVFINSCKDYGIRPLCVLEMTHPESDSYLKTATYKDILYDAGSMGVDGFIIPATKDPRTEIKWHIQTAFPKLLYDLYATGFKIQGGQAEPMRRFGVSKFIIGRAIYESENVAETIENVYKEINPK